jgi:hypothetical protein
MGEEEGAMWGEFVRRVEGKSPGKFGSGGRAQFRNNGTLEDGILSPRQDKGQAQSAMASLASSTKTNINSMASSLQGGMFIAFSCQVMFLIIITRFVGTTRGTGLQSQVYDPALSGVQA